jgi:hypothetical protein
LVSDRTFADQPHLELSRPRREIVRGRPRSCRCIKRQDTRRYIEHLPRSSAGENQRRWPTSQLRDALQGIIVGTYCSLCRSTTGSTTILRSDLLQCLCSCCTTSVSRSRRSPTQMASDRWTPIETSIGVFPRGPFDRRCPPGRPARRCRANEAPPVLGCRYFGASFVASRVPYESPSFVLMIMFPNHHPGGAGRGRR